MIAAHISYEWDILYANKREWTVDRGSRHDINIPMKHDYIEAAKAVIAILSPDNEKPTS